jgi:dTDP-4-amino-4,6-dideoxygalactose transaminase
MGNRPAILGNPPIFDQRVPVAKPTAPPFAEVADELKAILESGRLTKGSQLDRFEEEVAQHLGVKHAIAVSSCTAGLMLTYQALGLTGDVVVPSFTFMATVSALVWAGLRPVFADVDQRTSNLDPVAAEAAITAKTTALVAIHNLGNPAEVEELQTIADRHGLHLIFDAAHGFGSLYKQRPVGPQGDAQVFSLSPTKLLIAGEGGIVATNDEVTAERIRQGREYGNDGNYDSAFAGLNARLPELNALIGRHSLLRLEAAAGWRNGIAESYRTRLGNLPGLAFHEVRSDNRSSYAYFCILVDARGFGLTREQLAQTLTAENIETRRYYDPPVHRQTAYRKFATSAPVLTNTEILASRVLNLPMWSGMEDSVVSGVCLAIENAYHHAEEIKAQLTAPFAAAIA